MHIKVASLAFAAASLFSVAFSCEEGKEYCYYRLKDRDIPVANTILKSIKMPVGYFDPAASDPRKPIPVPEEFWDSFRFRCARMKLESGSPYIYPTPRPFAIEFCRYGCEFRLLEDNDVCFKPPL